MPSSEKEKMGVIRLNFSLGTLKGYIEKNIEVLETTGIPLTLFGMFSVTEKKLVNPIGEPVAVEELIKYALQTEQFACKISDIETLNTQNENTEQIKRAKTRKKTNADPAPFNIKAKISAEALNQYILSVKNQGVKDLYTIDKSNIAFGPVLAEGTITTTENFCFVFSIDKLNPILIKDFSHQSLNLVTEFPSINMLPEVPAINPTTNVIPAINPITNVNGLLQEITELKVELEENNQGAPIPPTLDTPPQNKSISTPHNHTITPPTKIPPPTPPELNSPVLDIIIDEDKDTKASGGNLGADLTRNSNRNTVNAENTENTDVEVLLGKQWIEKLTQEIEGHLAEIEKLNSQIFYLETEINNLTNENLTLAEDNEVKTRLNETLQEEKKILTERFIEIKKLYEQSITTNDKFELPLQEERVHLTNKITELENKIAELENLYGQAKDQIVKLQNQLVINSESKLMNQTQAGMSGDGAGMSGDGEKIFPTTEEIKQVYNRCFDMAEHHAISKVNISQIIRLNILGQETTNISFICDETKKMSVLRTLDVLNDEGIRPYIRFDFCSIECIQGNNEGTPIEEKEDINHDQQYIGKVDGTKIMDLLDNEKTNGKPTERSAVLTHTFNPMSRIYSGPITDEEYVATMKAPGKCITSHTDICIIEEGLNISEDFFDNFSPRPVVLFMDKKFGDTVATLNKFLLDTTYNAVKYCKESSLPSNKDYAEELDAIQKKYYATVSIHEKEKKQQEENHKNDIAKIQEENFQIIEELKDQNLRINKAKNFLLTSFFLSILITSAFLVWFYFFPK